ncbi:MAG TPA: O-methyltransferase [Polyangia bacterium]|nr:O-methyltransferase [Polyangia bacterium]
MIVNPDVERYLSELGASEDPVLKDMERAAAERNFPIIGPLVGRLCWVLAQSIHARDVFEMGSGFGYSTYWFAHAVGEGGRVVHTDGDARRSAEARAYLEKAGMAQRVTFEVGEAREIITRYPGPFDVVFIDVDKEGYPEALELARVRVRPGGLIVADNVLWAGRVATDDQSPSTLAVQLYNKTAFKAPDLVTTIVPLRDGVAISLKLEGNANPFRRRRGNTLPPPTRK